MTVATAASFPSLPEQTFRPALARPSRARAKDTSIARREARELGRSTARPRRSPSTTPSQAAPSGARWPLSTRRSGGELPAWASSRMRGSRAASGAL
eukprot:1883941-Pyramimonas_sp.AAC.1